MTRLSLDQIKERLKKAESRHQRWQDKWQECYDFGLPNRDDMYQLVPGEDRVSDIYDDTAVQAWQDFAGMMHESMFAPFGHIFELEPGADTPKELLKRHREQYREISEAVHDFIHASNAHTEIADAFTDYGLGTFNLSIHPDPGPSRMYFKAWPMSAVRLANGHYGTVDTRFNHIVMTPRGIKAMYPKVSLPTNLSSNLDVETSFWDLTYRDPDVFMRNVYHRHLIWMGGNDQESELLHVEMAGQGSNPNITGRFTKGVGEVYGRGPAYNTLASIKTVNLAMQLTLENADIAVGGIWKAPHDGVVNPDTINLVSGTIVPYMPGTNGLEAVQSPANFDLSRMVSSEYRNFIRYGFYVEDYEGQGKTPISSREVQARQVRLKRRMGRPFVRGIYEILIPTVQRVIFILANQGAIEMPEIDGRPAQVRIVSPLARILKADEVLRKTDSLQTISAVLGPQAAQVLLNREQIASDILRLYEQPDSYLNDQAKQNDVMQQLAQLMGGTAQGPQVGAPLPVDQV